MVVVFFIICFIFTQNTSLICFSSSLYYSKEAGSARLADQPETVKGKDACFCDGLSLCWFKMLVELYSKVLISHLSIPIMVVGGTTVVRVGIAVFHVSVSWRHETHV